MCRIRWKAWARQGQLPWLRDPGYELRLRGTNSEIPSTEASRTSSDTFRPGPVPSRRPRYETPILTLQVPSSRPSGYNPLLWLRPLLSLSKPKFGLSGYETYAQLRPPSKAPPCSRGREPRAPSPRAYPSCNPGSASALATAPAYLCLHGYLCSVLLRPATGYKVPARCCPHHPTRKSCLPCSAPYSLCHSGVWKSLTHRCYPGSRTADEGSKAGLAKAELVESCSLLSDLRGEDEVPKMSSRAWEGLKVVVSRPAGLLRLKVNLPTVALVEEAKSPNCW